MRKFAVVFVAGLVLAALFWAASRPAPPVRRGLPAIGFIDAQGRTLTLADFAGKVVVLSFWASWCLPCRTEMPAFDRLQQKFGDRGLAIVAVSIDFRGLAAVDAFYEQTAINALPRYLDPSREAAKQLGFAGVPSALIVDRRGREAARIEGSINWESARIATLLNRLLDER